MAEVTLNLEKDEIPKLENVKENDPIKITAEGKASSVDGRVVVVDFTRFDVETRNEADRELEKLNKKEDQPTENTNEEDSF
jgi:hypothetical protein